MNISKKTVEALKEVTATAETEKGWAWEHAAEAYKERDMLVCILARVYPSHRMLHTQFAKRKEQRLVVCIHTPAGELHFMLSEEMEERLADLEMQPNHWDGSKRAEKRARMDRLGRKL